MPSAAVLAAILSLLLGSVTTACGSQQPSNPSYASLDKPTAAPAPAPEGDAEKGYAMVLRKKTIYGTRLNAEKRPTAVVVFASWCGPCRYELATLGELREKYPTLRVIGINAYEDFGQRSDEVRLRNFVNENAPWLTQIVHADSALLREFGNIPNIPTLFVYDKSGSVVAEFRRNKRSPPTHEELEAAVSSAVNIGLP